MNVIEVGEVVVWPKRTTCPLCATVVELRPADISRSAQHPMGSWRCPRCGAIVPTSLPLAGAAEAMMERLHEAQLHSDSPALPLREIELGEQRR